MSPHGTISRYNNARCRCLDCRKAWAAYYRDYKRRRKTNDFVLRKYRRKGDGQV